MAIVYTPKKRFLNPNERISYTALDLLAQGTAIVEPETVGMAELDAADLATAMAAATIPTTRTTFTKSDTQTVTGNSSALLTDAPIAPASATIDSIVVVAQRYTYIYISGYIQPAPEGATVAGNVRFYAWNLQTTSEAITSGDVIVYAVHAGTPAVQPNMPNAALTVTPGKTWLNDNGTDIDEAISATGLNQTALPTISIVNDSITAIELNSSDIRNSAASLTGKRGQLITSGGPTSVPPGPRVSLGTVTVTGATTSMIAWVGQPSGNTGGPMFLGRVTSSNTVTVYAMNNSFNTFSVADDTVLPVLVY